MRARYVEDRYFWSAPAPVRKRPTAAMVRRFLWFLESLPVTGCVLWLGALDQKGYGNFRCNLLPGGTMKAHRFAWLLAGKKLPAGRHLDHKCRQRNCVNPRHLRLVSASKHGTESNGRHPRHRRNLPQAPDNTEVL